MRILSASALIGLAESKFECRCIKGNECSLAVFGKPHKYQCFCYHAETAQSIQTAQAQAAD